MKKFAQFAEWVEVNLWPLFVIAVAICIAAMVAMGVVIVSEKFGPFMGTEMSTTVAIVSIKVAASCVAIMFFWFFSACVAEWY